MARQHIRVIVTGRVQGVSFRAWTQATARELGLSGWVRNREDGSVEAEIAGPEAQVAALCERLWQGPRMARVSDVAVSPASGSLADGFEIRPG
ncbi:acylphosphatase [Roseivivax sp.]